MTDLIRSKDNAQVKRVRRLQAQRKARVVDGVFVLEHPKSVMEYLADFPERVEAVFLREDVSCVDTDLPLYWVTESVFKSMSVLKQSFGVLALIRVREYETDDFWGEKRRLVMVDQVQDPSNLGAIIRNALAFGVTGVLLSEGCADVYHPECVRAAGGFPDDLPVMRVDGAQFKGLLRDETVLYFLDPHSERSLRELDAVAEDSILVLGSEGRGVVSDFLLDYDDVAVSLRIEMSDRIESLNVAVASGVLLSALYEGASRSS